MRRELLLQIHRTMRGMQRRNRTISSAYGMGLGLLESGILAELLSVPEIEGRLLARRFRLSPVQICRAVASLKRQGLVASRTCPRDRRVQRLSVTALGRKEFKRALKRARTVFDSAFARLSSAEQQHFVTLMQKFLNSVAAPLAGSLPDDPPLMLEIRRLSRWLGIYGHNLFGLKLSPLPYHILSTICSVGETGTTVSKLSQMYGIGPSTVSAVVARLSAAGLVKADRRHRDRRVSPLFPTTRGIRRYRAIEEAAVKQLAQGCRDLSIAELQLWADLWLKYSGAMLFENEVVLDAESGIRRLRGAGELEAARRFLMEQRVKQGLLSDLPEHLAAAQHPVYGCYAGERLQICAEFGHSGGNWRLLHFVAQPEAAAKLKTVAVFILEQFFATTGAKSVSVSAAAASAIAGRTFPGRRQGAWVTLKRTSFISKK